MPEKESLPDKGLGKVIKAMICDQNIKQQKLNLI
jgi:hypothetical protein